MDKSFPVLNLDTITHVCICGGNSWQTWVVFEDYEIVAYGLDTECVSCGRLATAPTEIDNPDFTRGYVTV